MEKDNQSFNAAALAGKVDVVGLRGTGMSSHRDPRKCSGYRPSFPGTVAFIKDGKFYIKFDHLDKPRLCKEWSFDPTVLPAPAAEAVLKTF